MVQPKFCRDCIFSRPAGNANWELRCHNSLVAVKDSWNLSSNKIDGTSCRDEREKSWLSFPACGKSGKQFVKK